MYKYITYEYPKSTIGNNLKIAAIEIFNKEFKTKNSWSNLPEQNHVFKNNQNFITFKLGQTTSEINKKTFFSYKLENYNTDWSTPTSNNEITFSNLFPGYYVLKIKEVDSFHNSSVITSYAFSIEEPFYATWWFFSIIAVVLGGILNFAFQKSLKYNKEYVKSLSDSNFIEYKKNYLLYFGLIILLTGVFYLVLNIITEAQLIARFVFGSSCLLLYFMSNYSLVLKNMKYIFISYFIVLTTIYLQSLSLNTIPLYITIEFLLTLFFAYNVFDKFKSYIIFSVLILLALLLLYINVKTNREVYLLFMVANVIILVINFSRRSYLLNANDKLIFTNNIINQSNSITIACDNLGNVKFCSDSITKILGYTPLEVLNKEFWKLTADEDFKDIDYNDIFKPNSVFVRKVRTKSGEIKYIQWSDTKYGDHLFIASGYDITEKIEVEKQYQDLIQNASDVVYETNVEGYFTYVNPYGLNLLGYEQSDVGKYHFSDIVAPAFKKELYRIYLNIESDKSEFENVQFPVVSKSNTLIWVSQKVRIKRNERNEIIGFSAIARDITKEKELELKNNLKKDRVEKFNTTLNILTAKKIKDEQSIESVILEIFEETYKTIRVDTLSYWKNYEDKIELQCLFNQNTVQPAQQFTFYKKDAASYFQAIEEENYIEINSFEKFPEESFFVKRI